MAQRKTESRPFSQPSALLMLSPEEMNFSLLNMSGNLNSNNMPTLIPVPAAPTDITSQLLLTDEGDVDSFVGQVPTVPQQISSQRTQGSSIFSSQSTNYVRPVSASLLNNRYDVGFVDQQQNNSVYAPPPNIPSAPPHSNYQLPFGSGIPPPPPSSSISTTSSSSQFRHTGKFQYVAPPECLPSFPQQPIYSQNQYIPTSQPHYNAPPTTIYPPPNQVALGGFNQVNQDVNFNVGHTYIPVDHHWFFISKIDDKDIWVPFSLADTKKLEESFDGGLSKSQLVPVEGGRYDVDMATKRKVPVFWSEESPCEVRRCSWFYRSAGENEFIPYDEMFAAGLEESYKQTLQTSDFHKKLAYPNGETIIIHTPTTIVHYPPSSQPDAWGNVVNDVRPRVVRRGMSEFDNIPKDEREKVDHLVVIVQGFKPTFIEKTRKVIEYASIFRQIAEEMLLSHFEKPINDGAVGRIEFIPIIWSCDQICDDVINIDNKLKSLTLSSIGKLRKFTNETLLDILFFTSPSHAQKTATELTSKLNSTFDLFRSRHPYFKGGVSIIGHAIGSLMIYDILSNQFEDDIGDAINNRPIENDLLTNQKSTGNSIDNDDDFTEKKVEEVGITLDEVINKLDLRDYEDVFKREKIDVPSLMLLTDSDIKEIGLPLGPRKKVQEFIKDYKAKEISKNNEIKQQPSQQQQRQNHNRHQQNNVSTTTTTTTTTTTFSFTTTNKLNEEKYRGVDIQTLKFPKLNFHVSNFFSLGSPVALLLAMRGVHSLGDEFKLPTCSGYYNIFHPFDPLAYRMEPLILPQVPSRAVLIPHHKGRKRLHLELKESLARIGFDIKQRIVESFRSTWRTINNFAATYRGGPATNSPAELKLNEEDVDSEVRNVLTEIQQQADDAGSVVASSVADESDFPIGSLNQGRRIDFVLQEKPIEIFNDYLFALASSSCYWQSEDTALMILKEIYLPLGIVPHKPGVPIYPSQPGFAVAPPPKSGFVQPAPIPRYPTPSNGVSMVSTTVSQAYWTPPGSVAPPISSMSTNHEPDTYFNQPAVNSMTPNMVDNPLRLPPPSLLGGVGVQGQPMRPVNQMTGPPPRSGFIKL